MTLLSSFAIVIVAGLIHASFQLSVSMLTLLSSHTIGRKRSQRRLVSLTGSFVMGVGVMTVLLLSLIALLLAPALQHGSELLLWTIACGLLTGIGLAVWLFYYRGKKGTTLWIPRGMARFLQNRTKSTRDSSEAFGLGLSSVFGELLFIIAPLLVAALALLPLEAHWQLLGIALYTFVSLSSLLFVNGLVGSGHSISRIQKWREANKRFLQFSAGGGLLALSFYLYVEHVVTVTALAAAGGV